MDPWHFLVQDTEIAVPEPAKGPLLPELFQKFPVDALKGQYLTDGQAVLAEPGFAGKLRKLLRKRFSGGVRQALQVEIKGNGPAVRVRIPEPPGKQNKAEASLQEEQ